MLTDMEANSLVRGLIFAIQKTRSDLTESLGSDPVAQGLLAELHPFVFGDNCVLPRLVAWQQTCERSGVISGSDLFNFFKLIEMKSPFTLALLAVYGYTAPEEADIAWFTKTWPYLG